MRTDSVSLAAEAVTEIREVAARLYGKDEVAEEPRIYKTKSKNAQEAHEAIRPTSAAITPADVEGKIEDDLYRLYALIWKRAVASQMSHAVFDTVAVDMLAGADGPQRHLLRANGSTLVKPGYISVYQEGTDDAKIDDTDHVLPPMREGDTVSLDALQRRAAFHRAAAALQRGLAGEGARGARHRPPLHLRHHHLDAPGPRVRGDGQPALRADRHRQDRRAASSPVTSTATWSTASPRRWRTSWMRCRAARRSWTTPLEKFWKPFIHQVEKIEKTVTREQVAQARELGKDAGDRQADHACAWAASARSCRSAPRTTRRSRALPGCVPGRRWITITLADAMELFKLPRTLGETAGRRDHRGQRRALRPVREVRQQVRLAQGGRSLHHHARARPRGDPPQAGGRCRRA